MLPTGQVAAGCYMCLRPVGVRWWLGHLGMGCCPADQSVWGEGCVFGFSMCLRGHVFLWTCSACHNWFGLLTEVCPLGGGLCARCCAWGCWIVLPLGVCRCRCLCPALFRPVSYYLHMFFGLSCEGAEGREARWFFLLSFCPPVFFPSASMFLIWDSVLFPSVGFGALPIQ